METVVLCLANSKKLNERCVAGIDVRSGEWVRPVSRSGNYGAVPFRERQVGDAEPQLLDLIEMDLAYAGPTGFDYCYARENRWIEPTPWRRIARASPSDLARYCCTEDVILHSRGKFTRPDVVEAKPLAARRTLELRRVNQLKTRLEGSQWRCSFVTPPGIFMSDLPVTDLDLLSALNEGNAFATSGYAVVSLGVPYAPPKPDWDQGAVGWKLLAAWIPAA